MQELIKVTKDDNGNSVVSGRDLHEFLGVKDNYTINKWYPPYELQCEIEEMNAQENLF